MNHSQQFGFLETVEMDTQKNKFLVEQTTPKGTTLTFTSEEPKQSNMVYVFNNDNDLLENFLSHTKKRPGALDPLSKTFVNNLALLLTNFSTDESWFLNYLIDIMQLETNASSNVINGWIKGIEIYNNSRPNQKLIITNEIDYLRSLLARAQAIFENTLNEKNKKAFNEETSLIDKMSNGFGVPITTSINMDATLRGNVAEVIGKEYNAHLMVSSKNNEDKIKSFFLHDGLHNWLKTMTSAGNPELAANLSIGIILLALQEGKMAPLKASSFTPPELAEMVSSGTISLSELDSRTSGRVLAIIEEKGMTLPEKKNTIYQNLYKVIEGIARRSNYILKPTMVRESSEPEKRRPSKPNKVVPTTWKEKLNNLASEVVSQIESPKDITVKTIAKSMKTCFVSKADYESSRGIEGANIKSKEKTTFRLDNWQTALVESILSGGSLIAVGPTSGGKTLTSMVALDSLFRRGGDTTLMYVAPNFYQAFQAYSSMVKTFPKQTFGLITGSININPRECKYWVGTPEHLWTFATAGEMKFNIGIIDEIHTISSPDTASPENKRKADCLTKLIGLIETQFVGLSATIHPDDESKLALFVQDILNNNGVKIKVEFGLGGNKIKRYIPLVNKVFSGEAITDVSEYKNDKTIRVTPENTFKLMKMLSDKKMTPSLIFDMDEKASYTLFGSLVKYLNDRHQKEYVTWRTVYNNFSGEISNLNKEISEELANGKDAKYDKLRSKKITLINRIIDYISIQIRSALGIEETNRLNMPEGEEKEAVKIWPGSTRPRRRRVVIEEEIISLVEETPTKITKMSTTESLKNMAHSLTNGQTFELPNMIPQEISDLYEELRNLKLELAKQDLREMPEVCPGIGSYFRFGPIKKSNVFRQLYTSEKIHINKEDETAYNTIASLSDAEGVKFDDVKQIFKLMDIALSFGIGILIPTMPFCVQFQIMKMLNKGDITIVFASESLSMGVNFPARSCVVRTLQNETADIAKILQMGGRAGRRGAINDDEAYSITWNISNTQQVDEAQKDANKMPRLVLNLDNSKSKGAEVMIKNHKKTAIDINLVMVSAASIEALKQTTAMMEQTTTRLGRGKKVATEEDENKFAAREATGKKSNLEEVVYHDDEDDEEKKINKPGSKETFSRDASVISAITKCVNILANDLGFTSDTTEKLNKRIEYITNDIVNTEMLDGPYEWAERINLVKQGLQEVHTGLYKRRCIALLDYISILYTLVHRISMRYIGLVYQKDSSRSM